jgi:hypothetical protein
LRCMTRKVQMAWEGISAPKTSMHGKITLKWNLPQTQRKGQRNQRLFDFKTFSTNFFAQIPSPKGWWRPTFGQEHLQ